MTLTAQRRSGANPHCSVGSDGIRVVEAGFNTPLLTTSRTHFLASVEQASSHKMVPLQNKISQRLF